MPLLVPVVPAPFFLAHPIKIGHHLTVLARAYAAPSLASIPNASTSPSPTVSADDIPSEKLTQFVTAYSGVMTLIRRNESLIQTAETEQESIRLQQAIETAAVQLIEQAGLTRSEYIQLLSLANLDDEFGEKIVTLLQEKS